jgi:hypothetical protein
MTVPAKRKPAPTERTSKAKTRGAGASGRASSARAGLAKPAASATHLADSIAGKLSAESLQRLAAGRSATVVAAIRQAVLEGVADADIHRTWLAEIDRIACNTDNITDLRRAISAYLRQAGIERVEDFSDETRFVVNSGNRSGACRVTHPAYIDSITKRTILAGRASRD